MKIAIANSLLEPGTIPWGSVLPLLHLNIEAAACDYLVGVMKNVRAGITNIKANDISRGIVQVIRNHGINEVYGGYERLPWNGKKCLYQFSIAYRIPGEKKFRHFNAKKLI